MLFRDRIIRDVGKFRRMLLFLFDESTDLKSRINETLESDGKYKIEGVGKNLVTSFLFDFNPQEYCIWNNKVQAGLEKIGWPVERKGTRGDRYLRILEHLKRLRSLAPEGYANFDDLDYFLHIIAVEPEGERALDRILTGRIPVRVSEEFDIMEKTLSDFLERNFSKIFPRLRIYEDEEGKGVEYTTGVGRIDILATDEEANIVIMELKGGIARHDSLSQVLSYMQWVQENIAAEGKKVKGVIVAQDADDKLRFALKRVKDVDFYRFRVRFELEKT
jgi:hypothetical protein